MAHVLLKKGAFVDQKQSMEWSIIALPPTTPCVTRPSEAKPHRGERSSTCFFLVIDPGRRHADVDVYRVRRRRMFGAWKAARRYFPTSQTTCVIRTAVGHRPMHPNRNKDGLGFDM